MDSAAGTCEPPACLPVPASLHLCPQNPMYSVTAFSLGRSLGCLPGACARSNSNPDLAVWGHQPPSQGCLLLSLGPMARGTPQVRSQHISHALSKRCYSPMRAHAHLLFISPSSDRDGGGGRSGSGLGVGRRWQHFLHPASPSPCSTTVVCPGFLGRDKLLYGRHWLFQQDPSRGYWCVNSAPLLAAS